MPSNAEVVIIGAGITGCSIAYYLAQEGIRAQIIERNAIGSEASGMSPGVLAPLMDMEAPGVMDVKARWSYVEFNLEGFRLLSCLHEELREETGVDVQYRRTHILHTAFNESDEKRLKAQIPRQQASGIKMGWLERDDLKSLYPGLGPKVQGALCWYDQAEVEAYRLTLAYAQAAELRGACIRQGIVMGIRHHGSRVTAVVVSGKEIQADAVVLAMGPWSKAGGLWFGRKVPVVPVRGQIMVMEPASVLPPYLIFHGLNYVIPKAGGLIMAGTTLERVGFRNRVTQAGRDFIMRGALSLSPLVGKTRLLRAVSGLRPNSEDSLPIIGRLPGWDNTYVAAGNGPQGIILSAITGRTLAELISRGHTQTPIDAFDPARFESVKPMRLRHQARHTPSPTPEP
jgi:glycine oxidase